jgi:hypothetical protein
MAKRIGLANRYTSTRKEEKSGVYLFNDNIGQGIPIEHVGQQFDEDHKSQAWNILDYFDNGYVVMQGDKEAIMLMLDLWSEDSERLNLQGRVKTLIGSGKILLLFLLDPSGKKRLHEFGIKPVPKGVVSITVKIKGNSVLFDLWVPTSEKMKIDFVNNLLKSTGNKEEES